MAEHDKTAENLAKRIENWIGTLSPDVAQAVWYLINKGKLDELLDVHTQWLIDTTSKKNGSG